MVSPDRFVERQRLNFGDRIARVIEGAGAVARGNLRLIGAISGEIAGALGEVIAAGQHVRAKFKQPIERNSERRRKTE